MPVALKIQEIEMASVEDEELQKVRNYLLCGNWENAPKPSVIVRNEVTFGDC